MTELHPAPHLKRFYLLSLTLLFCIAVTPISSRAANWVQIVPQKIAIDIDSIHEDNRLPAVGRYGAPLEGKVYAATFREEKSEKLTPYSVDDPKAKKYRTAWDVHQAERYFLCQKNYSLMTIEEGPVVDHLRGKWMRAYDDVTDEHLKRRLFIDWTTMPEGLWTGMNGAAVEAGKIICDKVTGAGVH